MNRACGIGAHLTFESSHKMSVTPRQISAFLTASRKLEEVRELTQASNCSQLGPGDSPPTAVAPKPTVPGRVALNAYADPLVYMRGPDLQSYIRTRVV